MLESLQAGVKDLPKGGDLGAVEDRIKPREDLLVALGFHGDELGMVFP